MSFSRFLYKAGLFHAAAALPALAGAADAAAPAWPGDFVHRVEALALMQTLNANLLASRSATRTLETWCRDHRLADDPTIRAERLKVPDKAPSAEQRAHLQIGPDEPVRYRHVRLRCGAHVLSEAENWYVPARLSADANRLLDTTDTPFGKVVAPLKPYRITVAMTPRWSPLPSGWESAAPAAGAKDATLAIPAELFEHEAVVYSDAHQPIAEVVEVYQGAVLAFPPPSP